MAQSYRKLEPKQTISSFSPDSEVPAQFINNAQELTRRDDEFVSPEVRLEDSAIALRHFLTTQLPAKVKIGESIVDVPVVYADAERWASVQERGYLRDHKGKLQAPVIAFKMNSFADRPGMDKADVRKGFGDLGYKFTTRYTAKNRYDQFSAVANIKPVEEVYTVTVPEWIEVFFDIYIWTDKMTHLAQLFDKFKFYSGRAVGDTFKFPVKFDGYTVESLNTTGDDRFVRGIINCRMQSYIVLRETENERIEKKDLTQRQVLVITETVSEL